MDSMHYAQIVCCNCGVSIDSNPLNMCPACVNAEVDITEALTKTVILSCCPVCERYHQPPSQWVRAQLESPELLSICLKRLKGLSKVNLVDAAFVWTEPHSKRLKVKVTVQQEVQPGAVVQQVAVVDFEVKSFQCTDCNRAAASDFWRALVQIRQKTSHKKLLFYLEQLIIKHDAHKDAVNMKQMDEGIDFYFSQKIHALAFVQFLTKRLPCTQHSSKTLLSTDIHTSTHNCKFTFCVDIPPVNKDEVVILPKATAQKLGNMGQLCIVDRVLERIHLIDPLTCQMAEMDAKSYFANPFHTIGGPRHLSEFLVLETEIIKAKDQRLASGHSRLSSRHLPADVYVMKGSQMDEQIHCRTHLGRHLRAGDTVLGFDLRSTNFNSVIFDKMKQENIPDVILVRKVYGDQTRRSRRRKWALNHLKGLDLKSDGDDMEAFKNDLEEDAELRKGVNIYRSRNEPVDGMETDTEDEGGPQIPLYEMLDSLDLSGAPAGPADGAGGMDMD